MTRAVPWVFLLCFTVGAEVSAAEGDGAFRQVIFFTADVSAALVSSVSTTVSRRLREEQVVLVLDASLPCSGGTERTDGAVMATDVQGALMGFCIEETTGVIRFVSPLLQKEERTARRSGDPGDPAWPEMVGVIVSATVRAITDRMTAETDSPGVPAEPPDAPVETTADETPKNDTKTPRPAATATTTTTADVSPFKRDGPFTLASLNVDYQLLRLTEYRVGHGVGIFGDVVFSRYLQISVGYTFGPPIGDEASDEEELRYFTALRHAVWLRLGLWITLRRFAVAPSVGAILDTFVIRTEYPERNVLIQRNDFNVALLLMVAMRYHITERLFVRCAVGADIIASARWHALDKDNKAVNWVSPPPYRPFMLLGVGVRLL